MLKLYFDQHVKLSIAEGLRLRGVDVLRTQDDGTSEWADEDLLIRATALDRIVFTNDEDFLRIGHNFQHRGRAFAGVVFADQTAVPIGKVLDDLELICKAMAADELANLVMHLPLR